MDVQLVVIKGNPRGRTLSFGPGEYVVGRGAECHIRPDSEWVSRQHCTLTVTAEHVHLKDLGSTNGTLVNGNRLIGERDIVHGDTIQVGPLVLQVRMAAQEAVLEALKQTDMADGEVTLADGNDPRPQEVQSDTARNPSENKSE